MYKQHLLQVKHRPEVNHRLKVLHSNRSKNESGSQDLMMESQLIAGMVALHTMSWYWQSSAIKNAVRNIDLCMKAIVVKCIYLTSYCLKLLHNKYIGMLWELSFL
jgi:hypothetical protein